MFGFCSMSAKRKTNADFMWPFRRRIKPYRNKLERLEGQAALGWANAQFELGMTYVDVKNIGPDDSKGLALIQQAAEQRAAIASNTLGTIYLGRGDLAKGFQWYEKAAEQGLANAQGMLGFMHSGLMFPNDKTIPRDIVKACAWLTIAAANDCPGDSKFLNKLVKELTPQQIVQVENLIVELLVKLPRIPFREHAERLGLLPFVNSDSSLGPGHHIP